MEHKESFGSSEEFVQSLDGKYRPNEIDEKTAYKAMLQETHFLASSSYEQHTGWGEKAREVALMLQTFSRITWITLY